MIIKTLLQDTLGRKSKAKSIVLNHFTLSTRINKKNYDSIVVVLDSFVNEAAKYAKSYTSKQKNRKTYIVSKMVKSFVTLDSSFGGNLMECMHSHGVNDLTSMLFKKIMDKIT